MGARPPKLSAEDQFPGKQTLRHTCVWNVDQGVLLGLTPT